MTNIARLDDDGGLPDWDPLRQDTLQRWLTYVPYWDLHRHDKYDDDDDCVDNADHDGNREMRNDDG